MTGDELLSGDVAIVTGGGCNIGLEIARKFAGEGARVVVADIDEDRAIEAADSIVSAGDEAIPSVTDVTDEEDVEEMVTVTEREYGPVDILVNNAALTEHQHFLDLDPERFDQILDVNLRGPFLCTKEVSKSMKRSGGGRIVNVASTSAHRSREEAVAYATSKSGLVHFTRCTAKALADHGIRVNTLSPTRTGSPLGDEQEWQGDAPEDILVGRWGKPEDQANAALFLVSPENDFINAEELLVDGGSQAG